MSPVFSRLIAVAASFYLLRRMVLPVEHQSASGGAPGAGGAAVSLRPAAGINAPVPAWLLARFARRGVADAGLAGAGGGPRASSLIDDRKPAYASPRCPDFPLPPPARLAHAAASGAALIAAALLQSLPWLGEKEVLNALLLTLTGGLTLAPTCLVFWHYLTSTVWQPLGPALVSQPVNWRARHLIWYLLLFMVSLWLQLGLPAELSRFTPFCWRCRSSLWPGTTAGRGADRHADERHRADRQPDRTIIRWICCSRCWPRA